MDSPSAPPGSPWIPVFPTGVPEEGGSSRSSSPAEIASPVDDPQRRQSSEWQQQQERPPGTVSPEGRASGSSGGGGHGAAVRSPSPSRLGRSGATGGSPRATAEMMEGGEAGPNSLAAAGAGALGGGGLPSPGVVVNEDPVMQEVYTSALQPRRRSLPRDGSEGNLL